MKPAMGGERARLPIIVLERETGRLMLLETLEDLRMFVEEFQDLLEEDFVLWDCGGRVARIEASFLSRDDDSGVVASADGTAELKQALTAFSVTNRDPALANRLGYLLLALNSRSTDDG